MFKSISQQDIGHTVSKTKRDLWRAQKLQKSEKMMEVE